MTISRIAMDKLLHKYKCAPSQAAKEWAQKFWKDEDKVVERIEQCRSQQKIKKGKGKGIICAVLGACLSCAQKEYKESSPPEKVAEVAYAALRSANETWDGDIWYDNDNNDYSLESSDCYTKTEIADEGDDNIHTTVQSIPWSPAELTKLQEKYSRRPEESETEYVWRVSLTGGDRILLSEGEAEGYWGPGVFLTTPLGNHSYSLTARAAYWAGGLDPQERGDPLVIETTGFSDLVASVQKAACIQAMYEREALRRSPMLAPVNPARLTPLIRGLPDSLKTYVANAQDRIQTARAMNAGAAATQPPRNQVHVTTWNEFVQEIINYGRRTGWVGTRPRGSTEPPRWVRQVRAQPRPKPKFDRERNDLWRRALAMGVPRQLLHGTPTADLRALVKICWPQFPPPKSKRKHCMESLFSSILRRFS
uniref:Uncharacterized protein n=1 Tax=Apteryx owenii TaxID=8824 RepID=A0A8B9NYL3_APTOW